jgi:hypothetical protein
VAGSCDVILTLTGSEGEGVFFNRGLCPGMDGRYIPLPKRSFEIMEWLSALNKTHSDYGALTWEKITERAERLFWFSPG